MIDPRSSDIAGIGRRADDGSPPGMPRWVKVVGLVMVVVALVLVAVFLLGGEHGPARHASAGDTGGVAAPAAAQDLG